METVDLVELLVLFSLLLISLMWFFKPEKITDLVSTMAWNKNQHEQWKSLMQPKVSACRIAFLVGSIYWLFRIVEIIGEYLNI